MYMDGMSQGCEDACGVIVMSGLPADQRKQTLMFIYTCPPPKDLSSLLVVEISSGPLPGIELLRPSIDFSVVLRAGL
jgi:hypothetical protein